MSAVAGLELWLIRHGQTIWNAEGRAQGQLDSSLSELGVKQAERLRKRLKHETFDAVYSSDSGRAVQTANIALPGADLVLEPRLREISFGVLEGKTQAERSAEDCQIWDYILEDRFARAPTGGETWQEHIERVGSWLEALSHSGKVAAFTHGGSVRAAVFYLIGHHSAGKNWHFRFGNTSISRFRLSPKSHDILSLNDTAHLEEW